MKIRFTRIALWAALPLALVAAAGGCKGISATADEANDELAQAAVDQVDGINDALGVLARRNGFEFEEARYDRADCGTVATGACVNNVRTRNFDGCTIRTLTFTGSTSFTFNDGIVDNTCNFTNGQTLYRKPNWTITGARGWTIKAETTGTKGQQLTRVSNTTATFENDGVRRYATTANGEVITDFTTRTTEPVNINGIVQTGRVVTGGKFQITNNLTGVVCTVTPTNLTWDGSCTCAETGTIDGTCTDGTSYSVEMGSCGSATISANGVTTSVNLGRCTNAI